MKCIHCGNVLSDGDLFCGKCGKKLILAGAEGNQPIPPVEHPGAAGMAPEMASAPPTENTPESSSGTAPANDPKVYTSPSSTEESVISKLGSSFSSLMASLVQMFKSLSTNQKICAVAALVVVVVGLCALFDGDSGYGSSRRDYWGSSYDYYDDYDYYDYYGDDYDGGYTPHSSSFDCSGCTNGWCNLCDGSGVYRNYGEAVDCACDDGRCTICDGSGIIN